MDTAADLIYLDHAATSFPKPPPVAPAMADFLQTRAVSAGRSGYDLAQETARLIDDLRLRLGEFFGNPARDPDRTVFTANATDALNLAIQGCVAPGDHVVTTVLEHNSVLRPLHELQRQGVIDFSLVPCDGNALIDPHDLARSMTPRTRLVIINHASNVCGTVQPIAACGAICREREVLFLLDAAQSAGKLDIDMASAQIDLLAFTGHKGLLGPTGTGGLVLGPRADVRSTRWGGTGVSSGELDHPELLPYRLEAGTHNAVGLVGLAAALQWLQAENPARILAHEQTLAHALREGCAAIEGVDLPGVAARDGGNRGPERVGVVALTVNGRDPEQIGAFLDVDWNIAVRTGLQCAPLAHRALGTAPAGTVRFSFGPFNTAAGVERSLNALAQLARRS
jgi:cysteine desulfurase family protein